MQKVILVQDQQEVGKKLSLLNNQTVKAFLILYWFGIYSEIILHSETD